MRFKTTRDNLLTGITTVGRAVAGKSPMPVLGGILIEADEEGLTFTGTNLELYISCRLTASDIIPGSIVLPARYFSEIIRRLPEGPVSVVADLSSYSAAIRYGRAEASLNGYAAEEFPHLPVLTPKARFTLRSEVLRDVTRQVLYAVGEDELRPVFTGVLLELTDQELRAVATDTHRLALARVDLPGSETNLTNVILPGKALAELGRLLSAAEDEDTEVAIADSYASFGNGPVRVLTRLIEGQFPDYRQVIPGGYRSRLGEVEPLTLLAAVERASTLAANETPLVVLELKAGELIISARSQVGSLIEELPAALDGEALQVAFNAGYLIDALRAAGPAPVSLEFNGPVGPALVRPVDEGNGYLGLVLPVRLA